MGGCCCGSSNRVENNASRLDYYPVVSAERRPLSSFSGTASAFPPGLLVDTNLDTNIPDTYRHPPAPPPYDANAGNPQGPLNNRDGSATKGDAPVQTNSSDPVGEIKISNSGENVGQEAMKSDCKELTSNELVEPKEVETEVEKSGELQKSSVPFLAPEECPTCLEEYDEDNPKIITRCEHHFHLSCILEWMERSSTCPVCDQEMVVNFPIDD